MAHQNDHIKSGKIRLIHLSRIQKAIKDALPNYDIAQLSLIFKVLGDSTRLKIIVALEKEEMCVSDIAAFLGLTESAISHHLRRLKDLTLVKHRRDRQTLYYTLNDEHVSGLIQKGLEHIRE